MSIDDNMPPVTDHHDGFGLNDEIEIQRDPRDPEAGNMSHEYNLKMDPDNNGYIRNVAHIQFQHGPRHAHDSVPGVTNEALLAVVLDRLRGAQAGPYRCRENAIAITDIESALLRLRDRAWQRRKAGVLGKNEQRPDGSEG